MARDPDLAADLARYGPRPFRRKWSAYAVRVYRFGRRVQARRPGPVRNGLMKIYWLRFRLIELLTGISLPVGAQIGPGLLIHHFGNIFIDEKVKIGRNCTLRQGVTIGNRHPDGGVPVIEDDVEFGAYAQVLGAVRIGRGARIGAMSVVLCDVPPGATAVGIPARIITH
ncbi:MAG TPA: serine acetyltransferase [Tepidisphaeraceae bacterium]|nr:serine acetyltransferase [Tepidisphaeraceae bacterium]